MNQDRSRQLLRTSAAAGKYPQMDLMAAVRQPLSKQGNDSFGSSAAEVRDHKEQLKARLHGVINDTIRPMACTAVIHLTTIFASSCYSCSVSFNRRWMLHKCNQGIGLATSSLVRALNGQNQSGGQSMEPLVVVGFTHSQTGLVLRGRLRALRRAGFRVVLISSPGPLLDSIAVQEGAEALAIPMERRIAPFSDVIAFLRLCRALLVLRPDISEFSTPKAGLLGSLAAFLCRVPCRIYLLRGLRLETVSGMKKHILKATEMLASACSHVVLCNSGSLLKRARSFGIADDRKLRILGYGSSGGVDIARFAPGKSNLREVLGIETNHSVIGFVGRLTRDKGVPELIKAFDDLRQARTDLRLLLVGWFDDSEDAISMELRAYIESHPVITRTGFVYDTAPYYRIMDVLVLPSLREGFPNVVLEAGASGIPTITTLATGSCDAVLSQVTGLLIPPGDPKAIAAALWQLLEDGEMRRRMGRAARDWVTLHYSNEAVHGRTIDFYRGLASHLRHREATAQPTDAAALVD